MNLISRVEYYLFLPEKLNQSCKTWKHNDGLQNHRERCNLFQILRAIYYRLFLINHVLYVITSSANS